MAEDSAAIVAEGLTRRFGTLVAVDAVDLRIAPSSLFGFLGRNGAGKTTVIRLLLGLIRPTSGQATILGMSVDPRSRTTRPWADVGYLVDGPGLYPELTTRDHLRIAATYRGVGPAQVADAVERLALARYLHVRARALSQGNRQRLGLAVALLNRPRVLILDEPTIGMDPAGVVEIRAMLRDLADAGTTVFMSTHIVSEVELMADEVGIIHEGRLVDLVTRAQMATLGQPRLVVTLPSPAEAGRAGDALGALGMTSSAAGVTITTTDARAVDRPEDVVRALVAADCPPRGLAVASDSLETHFLEVTGGAR
ncbi:MAG: ABC transporter ATP-binding protein [Candidatus Nanopelagicales bacterium]